MVQSGWRGSSYISCSRLKGGEQRMLVEQVVDGCDARVGRGRKSNRSKGRVKQQSCSGGINIKACVASPSPGEEHANTIGLVL